MGLLPLWVCGACIACDVLQELEASVLHRDPTESKVEHPMPVGMGNARLLQAKTS